MRHTSKKLIEVALPLEAINTASARENTISRVQPSMLHLWWARRPLAIMRAAIIASLVSVSCDDKEIEGLQDLIAGIADGEQVSNGNSLLLEEAKKLIRQNFPEEAPKILDPFMGGGSTGLESLRMGCETYGTEYNPVAYLIELCMLVYPQKFYQFDTGSEQLGNEIKKWGKWVANQAQEEIGYLYKNPTDNTPIVGYLWARTALCSNPACGALIPLVRNWWLSNNGKRKIVLHPLVRSDSNKITFEIVNTELFTADFDPSQGTFSRGIVQCPVCHNISPYQILDQATQSGRIAEMPLVVIYQDQNKQKCYRPVTEEDIKFFQIAQSVQEKYSNYSPDEYLVEEFRIRRYGFSCWRDFFNARQTVTLAVFCKNIRSAYEIMLAQGMEVEKAKIITTYLGLSLDNLASGTSALCRWLENREVISSIFVFPDFVMQWSYAEANPFGPNNRWDQALSRMETITRELNFPEGRIASINQGTATNLKYPDKFFDAIITDPPYYDNIDYGNLSDFFYVWLKRSIGFLYPDVFQTALTPKDNQLFDKADTTAERTNKYEQELLRSLRETERTLKNDGILTIIYPYRSQTAFVAILKLLIQAGFITTATWPIRTNNPLFGQSETVSDQASLLIVSKKRKKEPEASEYLRVKAVMRDRIRQQLEVFDDRKFPISDYFLCAIGPAFGVIGQYRIIESDNEDSNELSEIFDDIQGEVLEFSLVHEYQKRKDEPAADINFHLAKGLIRQRVRKQLANFKGQNIWRTSFFIDRIDLSAEVFDYQSAQKDNLQRVEIYELLEIVENEFRDFILVEDLQKNIELDEPVRTIKCESCQKEYLNNKLSFCPICLHPNLYQIAITELTELSTQLSFQSRDPIIRQVLAQTERWSLENAFIRVVTLLETFLKKLNEEAFRISEKPHQKLPRKNLFQNVDEIQRWFLSIHGTDLFTTLLPEEVHLLKSIISKRHVITHNGGLIDDAYITQMNEDPEKKGKPVDVSENEILQAVNIEHRLIEIAKNAFLQLR